MNSVVQLNDAVEHALGLNITTSLLLTASKLSVTATWVSPLAWLSNSAAARSCLGPLLDPVH
eukprot:6671667-Pyramimonas_sp.AAC.1